MPVPSAHAPRVVLAPNAFKGTLSPAEAASAMASGVRQVLPQANLVTAPIADGGDGSLDAFVAAGYTSTTVPARGPTGERAATRIAVRGSSVVIELAGTCGMARLPAGPAPMTSSTLGLGDAMRAALHHEPDAMIVCLGGSASTDGGAGMLAALGARLLDVDGRDVEPGGASLTRIASLDLTGIDPRLTDLPITVAVDVTAPLVGPNGAAHVFAPQKGATPDQVLLLDAGLRVWSDVLRNATAIDMAEVLGAGAAGGTAAALAGALGARLVSGAEVILDAVGLPGLLADADLVITGEGRLDEQSSLGKGVTVVAGLARAADVPALAVCGQITLEATDLRRAGFTAWAASDEVATGTAAARVSSATALALGRWLDRR